MAVTRACRSTVWVGGFSACGGVVVWVLPAGLEYKSHCHASPRKMLRSMGLHVLTTPALLYWRMASPYTPIIHGDA